MHAIAVYRLEVLLDEREAAEVLAGEVLPPRHLLPVRTSSLQPCHARCQHPDFPRTWEFSRNKGGEVSGGQWMPRRGRRRGARRRRARQRRHWRGGSAPRSARAKTSPVARRRRGRVDTGRASGRPGWPWPPWVSELLVSVSFLGYIRGWAVCLSAFCGAAWPVSQNSTMASSIPYFLLFFWAEKQDQNPLL